MAQQGSVLKRLQPKERRRKHMKSRGTRSTRKTKKNASQKQLRGLPPVLSRYASTSRTMPGINRSRRARRRFDIALPTPGAEIRLPSLPVLHIGWRWASMAVTVVLLFFLYQLYSSASYRVEAAEINGLYWLSEFNVNSALKISGKPVFAIDPAETKDKLLNDFPQISTAEIEVGLPNLLVISVTERIPALKWVQGGKTDFVDVQGWSYPSIDHPAASRLPVVQADSSPPRPKQVEVEALLVEILEGDDEEEEALEEVNDREQAIEESPPIDPNKANLFMSEEMLRAILILAKRAPENAPLVYNESHGLGWEDPRGWVAHFGSPDDISLKLTVYEAIVARMAYDGIQPALISVEYAHAPYYRMER